MEFWGLHGETPILKVPFLLFWAIYITKRPLYHRTYTWVLFKGKIGPKIGQNESQKNEIFEMIYP